MLNFNHLRIFYSVAQNMSFTRAAEKLFISQPAVTTQIKAFEQYCSFKLFHKHGRRIYLTNEGKILFDYASKIFGDEIELKNAIDELRKLKRGVLRIGSTKTYAKYFMPFMLSKFHQIYPDIKIHFHEGTSMDMINSLLEFKNDLAIVAKVRDLPEICFIPFCQEELVAIVSPQHPLAGKKNMPFSRLAKEPVIMKDVGSGTRKAVDEIYERSSCLPDIVMETGNVEFIKQLVQTGEGFSFLIREAVAAEIKEGKLSSVDLRGEKMFLDVSIAYLKNHYLSPPAKALLQVLEKLANGQFKEGTGGIMAKLLSKPRTEQQKIK